MTDLIKKLNFRISFLIALAIIILFSTIIGGIIYAKAVYLFELYRVNGGGSANSKIISEHGICKVVTNNNIPNTGKDIFVPTKTSLEWSRFYSNVTNKDPLTIARNCWDGEFIWSTSNNTANYNDVFVGKGGDIDVPGVYVVGRQGGLWTIQKRSLGDGTNQDTDKFWTKTEEAGSAEAVTMVSGTGTNKGKVYVVGQSSSSWKVEALDTDGTVLWKWRDNRGGSALAVAADNDGIYVAGYTINNNDNSEQWTVIKLDPNNPPATETSSPVWDYTTNKSPEADVIFDIALVNNETTSALYAVGIDSMPVSYGVRSTEWRIEHLNTENNPPSGNRVEKTRIIDFSSNVDDYLFAIAVDSNGIYIAGSSSNLALITMKLKFSFATEWQRNEGAISSDYYVKDIAIDNTGLYIVKDKNSSTTTIIKRDLVSADMLWTMDLPYSTTHSKIAADSEGFYVTELIKNGKPSLEKRWLGKTGGGPPPPPPPGGGDDGGAKWPFFDEP